MLSAPVIITPPAQAPLSLADAKLFLRRDDASLDRTLQLMVDASLGELQSATGVRLIDQAVEVQADCFADLGALNIGPVTQVQEIRYTDLAGAEAVMSIDAYQLVGAGLDRRVVAATGAVLPAMRPGRGAITARLAVGYGAAPADVPQELRWALLALVRGKFDDSSVNIEPLIVNHRIYA